MSSLQFYGLENLISKTSELPIKSGNGNCSKEVMIGSNKIFSV